MSQAGGLTFAERSLRRLLRARPFYRTYPPQGPMTVALLDMRGFYSPMDDVFFNRIPKSGNSTVTTALANRSAYRRPFAGRNPKDAFLRPSWMNRAQVQGVAEGRTFAFIVVRNPYDRVLSAYRDKIAGRKQQSPHFLEWARASCRDDGFASFCAYLEAGHLHRDAHWAPQCDLLCLPFERFDAVLRLERLDAELPDVLTRIFGPGEALPGRSGPRTDATAAAQSQYTDETRAVVTRLYARDFDLFGYERAGF